MFKRRLGSGTRADDQRCAGGHGCPDLFELDSGDIAVIGIDMTDAATALPSGAGCGPGERIVRVPRRVILDARADIAALT